MSTLPVAFTVGLMSQNWLKKVSDDKGVVGELSTGVVGKEDEVDGETLQSKAEDEPSGIGEFKLRERKSCSTCYKSEISILCHYEETICVAYAAQEAIDRLRAYLYFMERRIPLSTITDGAYRFMV